MDRTVDQLYQTTAYLSTVQNGNSAIVWHSLFGNAKVVSDSVLSFLELFRRPKEISELQAEYEITPEVKSIINDLVSAYFLVPVGLDERAVLAARLEQEAPTLNEGSRVRYLELIMSETCNFRCVYCIHYNNLGTSNRLNKTQKRMSFPVAKRAIDMYFRLLQRHGKTNAEINFGGGEPLQQWSVIAQVLAYCQSTYGQEFKIHYSLNTNASLITPSIAAVLRDYEVSVAVSLDGLSEFNDRVRRLPSGHGTFGQIIKGIDVLTNAGWPVDGFATTVTEQNFDGVTADLIDWAREHKMSIIRLDYDVICMVNITIMDMVQRLNHVRRYASTLGITVVGFWSRPFENLNFSTLADQVAFCGGIRGNSLCVNPSGEIYACGYSTTQIGNLQQLETAGRPSASYIELIKCRQPGAIQQCRGCIIEAQCAGGCHITREFSTATDNQKTERMCELYRAMTNELVMDQLRSLSSPE